MSPWALYWKDQGRLIEVREERDKERGLIRSGNET